MDELTSWPNDISHVANPSLPAPCMCGHFSGGDLQMQQQARSQAQISFLQQQNALLNQQLATQAASYINQLQQSLHHSTPNVPASLPVPRAPPPSEPPQPKAPPEGTSSTLPSFNPDEMVQELWVNFKEEMMSTLRQFQDSNPPSALSLYLFHPLIPFHHNLWSRNLWLHNLPNPIEHRFLNDGHEHHDQRVKNPGVPPTVVRTNGPFLIVAVHLDEEPNPFNQDPNQVPASLHVHHNLLHYDHDHAQGHLYATSEWQLTTAGTTAHRINMSNPAAMTNGTITFTFPPSPSPYGTRHNPPPSQLQPTLLTNNTTPNTNTTPTARRRIHANTPNLAITSQASQNQKTTRLSAPIAMNNFKMAKSTSNTSRPLMMNGSHRSSGRHWHTNLVLKLPVNLLNTSVPNRCERSTKALMDSATKALGNLAPDIPSHKIKLVVHVLAGASLLDSVDLGDARRLPLPVSKKNALLAPMPELQKFRLRPPFGGKTCHTWALVHGTSVSATQRILLDSCWFTVSTDI